MSTGVFISFLQFVKRQNKTKLKLVVFQTKVEFFLIILCGLYSKSSLTTQKFCSVIMHSIALKKCIAILVQDDIVLVYQILGIMY